MSWRLSGLLVLATFAGGCTESETSSDSTEIQKGWKIFSSEVFQPDPASSAMATTDLIVGGTNGQPPPAGLWAKSAARVVNAVPYFKYWQSKEDLFLFHPMNLGSYVYRGATLIDKTSVQRILSAGVTLPNGGLAFYYPPSYDLARVRTGYRTYSGLAQAWLLVGARRLEIEGKAPQGTSKSIFRSLELDWNLGGVNLNGRALLEFPLFGSPPEIVLNGWLYALVRVADYWQSSGDADARALLVRNLAFLGKVLHRFDDPVHGLSKYSTNTPYSWSILETKKGQSFELIYSAKPEFKDDLSDLRQVPLVPNTNSSKYDVNTTRNGDRVIMSAPISSLYDLYILSNDPFSLKVDPGRYDPTTANPVAKGSSVRFESSNRLGGGYVVKIGDSEIASFGLYAGFPTNFSKQGGLNMYHPIHVVALRFLRKFLDQSGIAAELGANDLTEIEHWASIWADEIATPKNVGYGFGSTDKIESEVMEMLLPVANRKGDSD